MVDPRERAVSSIEEAQLALDRALSELDTIPSIDPTIVGFAAHALSSCANTTTAAAELLQHTLAGYPDPQVATWLDGIRHTADMMQHTIGRLLHASAPSDFPLKPTYVNLPLLMDRAAMYYRRLAEPNQIRIVSLAVGQIPLVWADSVAVAVVADNLLSNAVKVSPPGSTVYVQILPEDEAVVCSVRDAGPGLTREAREQLFQRMVAGPGGRSAAPSGGYGLAVAWELVDRMNGTLWCESEPGRGARFAFRLPGRG
jgi:signal transduction histidine kinase